MIGAVNEVTYVNSWKDLLDANHLVMRPTRKRLIALGLLALLGVTELSLAAWDPTGDWLLLLVLGLLSCFAYPLWRVILRFWLLPRLTRHYYRQAATLRAETTIRWDEAGLGVRSALATSDLPWSAYIGRREDDDTLVLFQTDTFFQFIPKRTLTLSQLDGLKDMISQIPLKP